MVIICLSRLEEKVYNIICFPNSSISFIDLLFILQDPAEYKKRVRLQAKQYPALIWGGCLLDIHHEHPHSCCKILKLPPPWKYEVWPDIITKSGIFGQLSIVTVDLLWCVWSLNQAWPEKTCLLNIEPCLVMDLSITLNLTLDCVAYFFSGFGCVACVFWSFDYANGCAFWNISLCASAFRQRWAGV